LLTQSNAPSRDGSAGGHSIESSAAQPRAAGKFKCAQLATISRIGRRARIAAVTGRRTSVDGREPAKSGH